MNSIKIAGRIIKKDKRKKNSLFLNILIAVPLRLKVYDDDSFKQLYNYISVSLFGLDSSQYSTLRKGSFVEIIGQIVGNSNEDGSMKKDLVIIPKAIKKGEIK